MAIPPLPHVMQEHETFSMLYVNVHNLPYYYTSQSKFALQSISPIYLYFLAKHHSKHVNVLPVKCMWVLFLPSPLVSFTHNSKCSSFTNHFHFSLFTHTSVSSLTSWPGSRFSSHCHFHPCHSSSPHWFMPVSVNMTPTSLFATECRI